MKHILCLSLSMLLASSVLQAGKGGFYGNPTLKENPTSDKKLIAKQPLPEHPTPSSSSTSNEQIEQIEQKIFIENSTSSYKLKNPSFKEKIVTKGNNQYVKTTETSAQYTEVQGWEKPETFNTYILHNVDQNPDGSFKNSSIISTQNTDLINIPIEHTKPDGSTTKSLYEATKWYYPKKDHLHPENNNTNPFVKYADISVQEAAKDPDFYKSLDLKNEFLQSIREKAIERIVRKKINEGKSNTSTELTSILSETTLSIKNNPEYKDLSPEEIQKILKNAHKAKTTKFIDAKIKEEKNKGFLSENTHESPEPYKYPQLRFKTDSLPCKESIKSSDNEITTADDTDAKIENVEIAHIFQINATNNSLNDRQKEYLNNLYALVCNDNITITKEGELIDRETGKVISAPSIELHQISQGVYDALGVLRDKTKTTKNDLEALSKKEPQEKEIAYQAYVQALEKNNEPNSSQKLTTEEINKRRKEYVKVASFLYIKKFENYNGKRELLIKAADENAATILKKSPHQSTAKNFKNGFWNMIGFSSNPTTSSSPQPALPSSSQ